MSRSLQDQVIDDDEEETCPLCVEEFDLSDKNFRPCPCGYQICQFCYNNIRTTMNGLCPACRRPYDDSSIEWIKISPEEYKAQLQQQQKKKAAARQKEAQKREADTLNRKHLAGIRVVQKNLVYVTGLSPSLPEDQLLQTLRGDQYFGQYGKIVKIVVSKAKDTANPQHPIGVYVTYARKEDAATCIEAVNGSDNGGRRLRAQYGTTKYCSAYLRNEQCNNRNCMFLHEPGEESESYTRQDLSSLNTVSTQHPGTIGTSRALAPPQQAPQPLASAIQALQRRESKDGSSSPGLDGPALPSTASWASRQKPDTAASSTSGASPAISTTAPASVNDLNRAAEVASTSDDEEEPSSLANGGVAAAGKSVEHEIIDSIRRTLAACGLELYIDASALSEQERAVLPTFPFLFDEATAGKWQEAMQTSKAEGQQLHEDTLKAQLALTNAEGDDQPASGSLQLGGEPEDRGDLGAGPSQQQIIQPPSQQSHFTPDLSSIGVTSRGILPQPQQQQQQPQSQQHQQQQQQQYLQRLQTRSPQAANLLGAFQAGRGPQAALQNHTQPPGALGHGRQTSRFNFNNDSTSVKATVNSKQFNQQNSMLPPMNNSNFGQNAQNSSLAGQFFSNVSGPPPGLKTSGTPPVSGGGMFGHGQGFASHPLGYGSDFAGRNPNEELLRNRNRAFTGQQAHEAGKRESPFPLLNQHGPTSGVAPAPGLLNLYGGHQTGPFQDAPNQQKQQKKKNKKHRHANTSSSGGGGMDANDSSILQARLHQGVAGANPGQGLYSAQAQNPFNPMVYGAGFSGGRW